MSAPLPNVFVVGAPKSGTTSFFRYIGAHPSVFVPPKKELHYFSGDWLHSNTGGPGDSDLVRTAVTPKSTYEHFFRDAYVAHSHAVDVSPSYLYCPTAAQRIVTSVPDPYVIALLRDPVERAFSQFLHLRRAQHEQLGFLEALDAEQERVAARWSDMWRYTESNHYARDLARYVDAVGSERVCILYTEDLRSSPQDTMDRVFRFLGLNPVPTRQLVERNSGGEARSKLLARLIHQQNAARRIARALLPRSARERLALRALELNTGKKPPFPEEARGRLQLAFRPDIAPLESLAGGAPPWRWV